ncbi:MAG: class I SAM-dependent methyltransferase [Planctomycetes bacterium]|nr:class I SAM-dependent methyltransferase [Planctomycetota bacterium]
MTFFAGCLSLLFLLGGLRLRGRARSLAPLPDSEEPVRPEHRFLFPDGVELDEATKRAASRYAHAAGLEVLDLVPANYPGTDLLGLLELVDPNAYRGQFSVPARTAGTAMLVTEDVMKRAGSVASDFLGGKAHDRADFVRAAAELKRCAPRDSSLALAPRLRHLPLHVSERLGVLRVLLGDFAGFALFLQALIFCFMALLLWQEPGWGAFALICFHGQALLALQGLPWAAKQMKVLLPFRLFLEVNTLVGVVLRGEREARDDSEARTWYEEFHAQGHELFEDKRGDCPHCGGEDLAPVITMGDAFQHKPGEFHLDRCASCGVVFQNPRLSLEGLTFHYRDFYDGAGAEKLDFIFSINPGCYADRAMAVAPHLDPFKAPESWLDSGGGHGHFCLAASELFPSTRFEVLDLSDAPKDAARRGWASEGHIATLPDFAGETDRRYDVISLSHCLEHVPDPKEELEAAARLLNPGGRLFIEVPDPTCKFGRWLGRLWLPWFQPQHLNLYPADTLAELCARYELEVLEVDHVDAHQPTDLHYAVLVGLSKLSPPPNSPWRKPTDGSHDFGHAATWLFGLPFLAVALLLDKLVLSRFAARPGWSNTYRLIARKEASA